MRRGPFSFNKVTVGAQPSGPNPGDIWIAPVTEMSKGLSAGGSGQEGRYWEFMYVPDQATIRCNQPYTAASITNWSASSPNFPWVFTGGTDWEVGGSGVNAGTFAGVTNTATFVSLATGSDLKFFPVYSGEYDGWGLGVAARAGTATHVLTLDRVTTLSTAGGTTSGGGVCYGGFRTTAICAIRSCYLDPAGSVTPGVADDLRLRYSGTGAVTFTYIARKLRVRPVRVAHTAG